MVSLGLKISLNSSILLSRCPILWKYKTSFFINSKFLERIKFIMSSNNNEQMERLEKNAQLAENLISDIYSKLSDLEKGGNFIVEGAETPQLLRLRQENESLRMEVAKWKELLILREIRNGGNPVLGNIQDTGRSVVVEKKGAIIETTGLKGSKSTEVPATVLNTSSADSADATKSKSNQNLGNKKSKESVVAVSSSTTSTTASGTGQENVDVSKLDFRIGLITHVERHPDADSLYLEKIDLGEEQQRAIISGLVKHVPIEEMRNRTVVVLANLKPAKMRGILSEGMVMCASTPEKVEILIPPSGSMPGDVVEIEGYPRAPETVLNPKKKIWETVAPDLMTNDKKEATYKGKLWTVPGKGTVTTSTLANTIIK